MANRTGRGWAAWLPVFLLAASAGWGWEQNLHRQVALDALFLAPPEVRDYFSAGGPCNIARYAENADLPPLGQGVGCGPQAPEERRKAMEAARDALWAAPTLRAFDLHKLLHLAADAFSPAGRLDCTADAPSFFEQHDLNIFVLGEGSFGELYDAFGRPPLRALVERSEAAAYILSVNAALRLLKDYYAARARAAAPPSTAALYRVDFIRTAFGGQKLWREVQAAAPSADGAYLHSDYRYYQDGGTAEGVNYINRCGLQMLGVVAMPGERETLFLADLHHNSLEPLAQANFLVNDQEVVVPVGFQGFGDAFVWFSLEGSLAPKSVRLTAPASPVVRVAAVRGRWLAAPSEVGLNGASASLMEMRHLTPEDVVKEPCRPAAPVRGNPSCPPKKNP